MSVSKARARKLAKRILRNNKKGRSYRVIVREDYPMLGADGRPIIKAGTLNRFAKGKGEWIPRDCEILFALGLKKPRKERKPRTQMQEAITAMSQMARQGLRLWKQRK